MQNNNNNKNLILACFMTGIILIAWTWLYEKPKLEAQNIEAVKLQIQRDNQQNEDFSDYNQNSDDAPNLIEKDFSDRAPIKILPKEDVIVASASQRIPIKTPELTGSINLRGLVFDDLTLVKYKETLDPKSKEVTLLSPEGALDQYVVNFNYQSLDRSIAMPNANSVWKAKGDILTPENPVIFSWKSPQKINFEVKVEIDKHYMFSVNQTITNNSGKKLDGFLKANIERSLPNLDSSSYILHEGPIGVFDGILTEKSYDSLHDEGDENNFIAQTGWFGITDKYWLVSIIPDKKIGFETLFSYDNSNRKHNYKVDYESQKFSIDTGTSASFKNHLFAGAKKVSLLDAYAKEFDIKLFDRAVDFGWYYFLTKPFFFILQFFNNLLGNYGLAILAITVLVKLAMYPLANKSYTAIARIKKLQPKIDKIRTEFKDKKMQMNKEIMGLYKREKVNPVSGCLPMLIQIPVFFSLYKVLYLTIDMRHAPFYGWIKDLSAPDPTSILNLFGLLPFDVSGIIAIGLWPIFMGITMIVQQKLNPQPADPVQAKVMKMLPLILIFVFAGFPAGLLIYWTWSNSLSILQQWYITRKLGVINKK
ncbi:MAG: YidC/Oxa1 family membrane protein insertase [Rickettsiales bacterium]|jgi:YidC/Oxa1 family membrane protein insertase